MSWPLVTIKSVATVTTGKTPSTKVAEYFGGSIPFITPAELGVTATVLSSKQTLTEAGAAKIKLVPKNSVLVCCIGSLGKLAIADRELGTNQQINSVTFDESKVYPKYGYYALSLLKPILESMAPATTVAIVNKSKFEALNIPLPPLEEQKRIAAILDKADAIRQKRQQAIELADEFLRSVFLDMFGDPVMNPKGWETFPIDKISQVVTGNTPPRSEKDNYGSHMEWIKSDNINTPNHYLTEAEEYLSHKGLDKGRIVPEGAILITCIAGSPQCIGNVAITNRTVAFNQQINALIPSDRVTTQYIYSLVLFGKKLIQSISTNSMKGMVSKGNLEKLCIPIPPIELQNKYSLIFKSLEEKFNLLCDSKKYGDDLFSSIQKKAFSGQL